MTGLDTNVVLRYLLQDDPVQTQQVNRIVDRRLGADNPGFISVAAVLEIVWVLRSLFRRSPKQIAAHIENLLAADRFVVQHEQPVFEAAYALKNGLGEFEDALIGALGAAGGCAQTVTFDRKAARLPSFKLIQ